MTMRTRPCTGIDSHQESRFAVGRILEQCHNIEPRGVRRLPFKRCRIEKMRARHIRTQRDSPGRTDHYFSSMRAGHSLLHQSWCADVGGRGLQTMSLQDPRDIAGLVQIRDVRTKGIAKSLVRLRIRKRGLARLNRCRDPRVRLHSHDLDRGITALHLVVLRNGVAVRTRVNPASRQILSHCNRVGIERHRAAEYFLQVTRPEITLNRADPLALQTGDGIDTLLGDDTHLIEIHWPAEPWTFARSAVRYQSPIPMSAFPDTTDWMTAAGSTVLIESFRHSLAAISLTISPSTPPMSVLPAGIE